MAITFLGVGIWGNWNDTLHAQMVLGITWQQLLFSLFALAVFGVVVQQEFKLRNLEKKHPKISVKPRVHENKVVLEVQNDGCGADFTAKGRVISCGAGCSVGTELYFLCWESVSDTKYHIDKGETAPILVGVNAPILVIPNYIGGYYGLWLVKMTESGKTVFSVSSPKEKEQRKLNERYPTMATNVAPDKCIIEVAITASPPLIKAFDRHRYSLEIDHEHGNKMLFVDVSNPSESSPDKRDYQSQ